MPPILRIGHRGAAGHEPENTLRSIQKALSLHAGMVEIDVHLCRTGEPVVIHDLKLERTTNGRGKVSGHTLAQLKGLNAGKGEKIPLLTEVLDLISRRTKINIELKGKGTAQPVVKIIETYVRQKGWAYSDFLVSTASRRHLTLIHKMNPLIPLGILYRYPSPGFWRFATKIEAYSVNPHCQKINAKFVQIAHKRNLKVFAWTANSPEDIKRLREIGVDGIFTDYPERV